MSMTAQGRGSSHDVVTQLQGIIRQLSAWVQAFTGRSVTGTFTLTAAATTAVTQPAILATAAISLTPTNAAAATLMGSAQSLYVSVKTPGSGFTVATANAVAAAGTETFSYSVINPL